MVVLRDPREDEERIKVEQTREKEREKNYGWVTFLASLHMYLFIDRCHDHKGLWPPATQCALPHFAFVRALRKVKLGV